ncbi:MAG: hypothetical protein GY696_38750 [Gammaproteobacteria bacterium]|nr:hypothetical protein [Gammaproteobacteria bacterium]
MHQERDRDGRRLAIKEALRGEAAIQAQGVTKASYYITAEEMIEEFMDYKQHQDEPALAYFANKRILFKKGYPNETYLSFLLLQTQEGLCSRPVRRSLLDVAHQFKTYEQLMNRTMTLIAAQRKAIQDGLSYDTCMGGLNSTTPYHQTSQGYKGAPRTEMAYSVQPARAYTPWAAPEPARPQNQCRAAGTCQVPEPAGARGASCSPDYAY